MNTQEYPSNNSAMPAMDFAPLSNGFAENKVRLQEGAQHAAPGNSTHASAQPIRIEAMNPDEYRNGGEMLTIRYGFEQTALGQVLIASTGRGICHIAFTDERQQALEEMKSMFPNAAFVESQDKDQQDALPGFNRNKQQAKTLTLHVKASSFQVKVWNALLTIPFGQLKSYSAICTEIGYENAARAVGSAIARNPIAFLIPCHRVIRADGHSGQYRWGANRKKALIAWEAKLTTNNSQQ